MKKNKANGVPPKDSGSMPMFCLDSIEERVMWLKMGGVLFEQLKRASLESGWWLRDFVEDKSRVPIALEFVRCGVREGKFFRDDTPSFFKLNGKTSFFVEAPELYEPLWNPESRKLQEMLAAGAPLQERYEQFEKQRRGKEAGK
jgi:hypothetical protein